MGGAKENNNQQDRLWYQIPPSIEHIIVTTQENDELDKQKDIILKNNVLTCEKIAINKDEYLIESNLTNEITVPSKNMKWFIYLPVKLNNNAIKWIKLLADSGANVACVKTTFAIKHFLEYIAKTNKTARLKTPGGTIHPKYLLWLSFLAKDGIHYKVKFYLVNDLPVNMIADLNMLVKFGYKFRDEIPPIFRHKAENEIQFDFDNENDSKQNYMHNSKSKTQEKELNSKKKGFENEFVQFSKTKLSTSLSGNSISLLSSCNGIHYDTRDKIASNDLEIKTSEQVNFCSNYTSFLASNEEIKEARKNFHNDKLKLNDLSYLKDLEKKDKKYAGLYDGMTKLIAKYYDKVFAKHTYDRRTYNIAPRRLGIKEKHSNKIFNIKQYPLNKEKRASIMEYTEFNEKNGFWHKIDDSPYNLPYIVILKPPDKRGYRRPRPAFDSRLLNEHCESYPANTPGPADFDEFFAKDGLMTFFDFKNAYDGIPLDKRDWKYVVSTTPFGLYQAKHFTYGHKNSAAVCQDIMNELAHEIGNTLIYVDDGCIKHNSGDGTKQLLHKIEQLFLKVVEKQLLLHPEKFCPCVSEAESVGFKRFKYGSTITEKYKKKILQLVKPKYVAELRTAIGVLTYIARYIYNYAIFAYWLHELMIGLQDTAKVQWTNQADYAWNALMKLVKNAQILYNPQNKGEFCLKCDACSYGIGAVLYQWQFHPLQRKYCWVIVDMWSKIMPQQLRNAHCSLHEALAVVWSCNHWAIYLMKRDFIIASDHKPLLKLFDNKTDLSALNKKQLLRLRLEISEFTFEMRYVKGLNNEMADILSRMAMKLFVLDGNKHVKAILSPLKSKDTNNKALTEAEQLELRKKVKELTTTMRDLRNGVNLGKAALQNHEHSNKNSNTRFSDYQEILAIQRKIRANYCYTVYTHSNPLEKSSIKQFINNIMLQTSFTNELDLKTKEYSQLNLQLQSFGRIINQISDETLQLFVNTLDNCLNQRNTSIIANNSENIECESNFDVCTSLTDLFDNIAPKTNDKQQQRNIGEKYTYIDPDIADIQKQVHYRERFVKQLFGRHKPIDFLSIEYFQQAQEADTMINMIKRYLQDKNNFEQSKINIKQFRKFKRYNNKLKDMLYEKKIKINKDNLIVVLVHDELYDAEKWLLFVPCQLISKIVDYGHHNVFAQHFGQQQTYNNISTKFWWPKMRADINYHVRRCIVCQFKLGTITNRSPLLIRDLPRPREHLMADFIGPFFKKYYILVFIDYFTGWTMLSDSKSCGTQVVLDMLLNKWVPIFGWFKVFETDLGSAFTSNLTQYIIETIGVKQHFSEPRNHKGTGKVERVIKLIQQIIAAYNIESGGKLVQQWNTEKVWRIVKSLLPFIQFGINQRCPRFTKSSPNMLMFGERLSDIEDISLKIKEMMKDDNKEKLKETELSYIDQLTTKLNVLRQLYKKDYDKYSLVTKNQYDKRFHITKHLENNLKQFQPGKRVLFYVGDIPTTTKKWRQHWSGPWRILKRFNDRTVEIFDPSDGAKQTVTIDRLKIYLENEHMKYDEYTKLMKERIHN